MTAIINLDRDTTLRLIENNIEVYWTDLNAIWAGNEAFLYWMTDNGSLTLTAT